jgi:hypothetical protein
LGVWIQYQCKLPILLVALKRTIGKTPLKLAAERAARHRWAAGSARDYLTSVALSTPRGDLARLAYIDRSVIDRSVRQFCHSGPVLGQIQQRIQCFRMRSDLRHFQAIPSNKPIFLRRIRRHRDHLFVRARYLAHVTTFRLWLFPAPTKNSNGMSFSTGALPKFMSVRGSSR